MDAFLERRGAQIQQTSKASLNSDWFTQEMIIRLPADEAERLLLKHWAHLRFAPNFVQAALYVSTPTLLRAARTAVDESPEPAQLMAHLSHNFGFRTKGHPGITREEQIRALAPYLHLLTDLDVGSLWEECNDHGWFATRRELLDERLQGSYVRRKWDPDRSSVELDNMIAENRQVWLDLWIDDYLKTGVSWREIMGAITAWLRERRSVDALRLVAAAVTHRGEREDLIALREFCDMSETEANKIITDTEYAVRRRSIG